MQNRGELFEDQFKASVPAGAYVRKLNTAGPRAQNLASVAGILQRLARAAGEEPPGWAMGLLTSASHTPKTPYDMIIAVDARPRLTGEAAAYEWRSACEEIGGIIRDPDGASMWIPARPKIVFALELKSTGTQKALRFDRLKPHQEKGLQDAANQGMIAGLVVEFPDVGPDGEVYFIPIGSYLAYKRDCGRQSLPLEAAQLFGLLIEVDGMRGMKHRYWKVAEFLRHFGADLPEELPKRRGSVR
jgi:hypothetical protein